MFDVARHRSGHPASVSFERGRVSIPERQILRRQLRRRRQIFAVRPKMRRVQILADVESESKSTNM